jgi:hypothetical protein
MSDCCIDLEIANHQSCTTTSTLALGLADEQLTALQALTQAKRHHLILKNGFR